MFLAAKIEDSLVVTVFLNCFWSSEFAVFCLPFVLLLFYIQDSMLGLQHWLQVLLMIFNSHAAIEVAFLHRVKERGCIFIFKKNAVLRG